MSNQIAMQQTIDLTGFIDLNKNKNTVRQFDGFTKRNSPFINGGLSPLFSEKEVNADVITQNGTTFKMVQTPSGVYHLDNDIVGSPDYVTGINAELKKNPSPELKSVYVGIINNKECWLAADGENIIMLENGTPRILYSDAGHHTISDLVVVSSNFLNRSDLFTAIFFASEGTRNLAYLSSSGVLTIKYSNYTLNPYGCFKKISNTMFYIYNDNDEALGNVVRCINIANNSEFYLSGYNALTSAGDVIGLETTFTDQATYTEVTFKGKGNLVKSGNTLNLTFTHNRTHRFYKTLSGNNFTYVTSIGTNYDIKLNFNKYFLSWSIPATLSNGETVYFFNENFNGQIIDDEGNMSVNLKLERIIDEDKITTSAYAIDNYYGVMYNNNELSAISYNGVLLSDFIGIDTSITLPYQIKDKLYYNTPNKNIVEISLNLLSTKKPEIELLYDNYIVIKGISSNIQLSALDIRNLSYSNISSDWNNRIIPATSGNTHGLPDTKPKYMLIGSGHNISYENSYTGIASSQFGLAKYRFYPIDEEDITNKYSNMYFIGVDTPDGYGIDLYYNEDVSVIPSYMKTLTKKGNSVLETIEQFYIGTTYPVQTENDIFFNPNIFTRYYISGLMTDSIQSINDDFYKLIYTDDIPVLLYAYASNIKDVKNIFYIQGQPYIIRNNVICSVSINGNFFENATPVINKGNLQLLGCSPLIAYFYSMTDRYIYVFTGDRNLQKYIEISEFTEIRNSMYLPDNNSLLLATDNGLYVIDSNSYIYCVEGDFYKVTPLNSGFAASVTNGDWNKYFYYSDTLTTKEKVKLKTSFYGVGNNQVSVIDTWYIKLYSPNKLDGKLIVNIETMTDITKKTLTQEFVINADQWDENGFIYIRYQPQYQRSVASSLELISDFELFELQASILPDNNKQLSADYKQTTTSYEGI